ncbi:MAG: DUF4861 family protein [Bacteroidota bacterium]
MKYHHLLFLLGTTLVSSCSSKSEVLLSFHNPLDQARKDAAILMTRGEISNWMEIPGETLPLLLDVNRNPIPCQADDVNGDGTWDELFALMDLPRGGQQKVILTMVPSGEYPEFESRTNLRLGDAGKPSYPELQKASRLEGINFHNYTGQTGAVYQMEGPAWENDKIGFRNYLDQRNSMDIFGKITSKMVLDSVGVAGAPSYHVPNAWGMDVLMVGTSLGAGGIGYLHNDSIYRVGDNGSGTYQVLFEGSQRSRFKLTYNNWKVEDSTVDVVQQIDISGGRHYYQSTVTYSGPDLSMELVAGIVNMKSRELHVLDADPNHVALFTQDAQAEDGSILTMALLIPLSSLLQYGETKKSGEGITETSYAILDTSPGNPVTFRFYAFWEKEDPGWANIENVNAYLKSEAERWTRSVDFEILK